MLASTYVSRYRLNECLNLSICVSYIYFNIDLIRLLLFQICDLIKVHTDMLEANQEIEILTNYGINYFSIKFEDKPVLIADGIVSLWYSKADGYNYFAEPSSPSKETGKFIVLHMMFITTFLELLVYCCIKYRNKITLYLYIWLLSWPLFSCVV